MMAVSTGIPIAARLMERPLARPLSRRTSSRHGVSGYDRRAFPDDDYRLFALWHIVDAAGLSSRRQRFPTVIWWNNFERIHMAVEDLGCRERLE